MIWVVLPALNEAANLRVVVPRVLETVDQLDDDARVLVVDDGSTDDTLAVVDDLRRADNRVELESMRHNRGKAAALQRGFRRALSNGATKVIMMDADGQDDPAELPRLIRAVDAGSDLVTGARRVRHDRFIKRNTSKVYNAATAVVSGAPGKDFNSGYKAMRADVAEAVAPMLYGEMHRYLTVMAHELGYRVTEEPVQHHPRLSGKSKYGLARFWRGLSDLLTIRFLLAYENRPSHLFGGVGALSLLLGVAALTYLVVLKIDGQAIGDRPLLIAGVLMTMVGLQLVLFGLLAELIVHARNRGLG